ncbi:MAG: alpha-ketoacid dehydrogenase subunit beta [Hyphomicrobiales bacterium]|nr:MAG: alpha-ketoacid dehydrogenase subunit beta [Hyphomicrobiales bacterium]
MARKTYREAINQALDQEMARDDRVILIGEDIAGGTGASGAQDAWGGVMGVTKGLIGKYGPERVLDTPISELALVGAGAGAAATGLRPVVELMFNDFLGVCLDQLMNQAAKFRYMFGGRVRAPLVVRTQYGAGLRAAAQHSQTLYSIFAHIPGLKVAVPSNPYDAKGLLMSAIRDDDPVIFMEHKAMYDDIGEVPDEAYTVPFGEGRVLQEGKDVTVIAIGRMLQTAEKAIQAARADGIRCSLVDPRTISPLDEGLILEMAAETGRVVIVDEANPRCGVAADIASLICEQAFGDLQAPVVKVTAPHTPVPFAPVLEDAYLPSAERIAAAIKQVRAY